MLAVITKILTWLSTSGAGILGTIQAVIKCVKEVITAVIDVASIFISKDKLEGGDG